MDRSSKLTDAYVEVRLGDLDPQQTDIARKTLNPVWDHVFMFEVSDDDVLNYGAISINDPVVLLDPNSLLEHGVYRMVSVV